MKAVSPLPAILQWQKLLEIAAQSFPSAAFWLECDAIVGRQSPGPEEIAQLKALMKRHKIWY